jgi:hypothetical protein
VAVSLFQDIDFNSSKLTRSDKIKYSEYGKDSEMGWNVDHSKPLAENGTYHPNNLQALQTAQNKSKNATYPYEYSENQKGVSPVAPDVDLRSSAVRSQSLTFKPDGKFATRY